MSPSDPSLDLDIPPIERGVSPIAGRLTRAPSPGWLVLAAAVAGVVIFAIALAQGPSSPATSSERLGPAQQVVQFEPARGPTDTPFQSEGELDADDVWDDPPEGDLLESVEPDTERAPAPTPPSERPFVIYSQGSTQNAPPPGVARQDAESPTSTTRANPVARATAFAIDRRFSILAGSHIPCILETALESSRPGLTSCIIPTDVRSDDGALILMERGARVLGEYQTGLASGERRLHVLWTRAVTPDGIAVALASPAGDALGRAGLPGELDTRFWERFSNAVILSVLQEGASQVRNRDAPVVVMGPSAATDSWRQSQDLAPRLSAPQGSEVTLQVAQDLDFSAVYALRLRQAER